MKSDKTSETVLENPKVHIKLKLAGLWVALMFCYVYGDIVGLFNPGVLQGMLEGKMGPLGEVTPGLLVAIAALMSIPALMVFLSLVLKAQVNRWLNIVVAIIFTVIMVLSMIGADPYYLYMGFVEIALKLLIIWYAWKWPEQVNFDRP